MLTNWIPIDSRWYQLSRTKISLKTNERNQIVADAYPNFQPKEKAKDLFYTPRLDSTMTFKKAKNKNK